MKSVTNCSRIKTSVAIELNKMVEKANEIKYPEFEKHMENLFPNYEWKPFLGTNRYFKSVYFKKPCVYIRDSQNEHLIFTPIEKDIVMHVVLVPIWEML